MSYQTCRPGKKMPTVGSFWERTPYPLQQAGLCWLGCNVEDDMMPPMMMRWSWGLGSGDLVYFNYAYALEALGKLAFYGALLQEDILQTPMQKKDDHGWLGKHERATRNF